MTLALIRHGQTDWNRDGLLQGSSDIPLNSTGTAQAQAAVETLRSMPWDVVVSSTLQRARTTAKIIADALSIDLGPSYEELNERDYGPLEGTPAAEAIRRWPDRNYPGAETLEAVAARGEQALSQIVAEIGNAHALVVCHGTIIRYTLARLAGRPVPGIDNGSVSLVRPDGDRWSVLTVNGVPLDDIPIDYAAQMPSRAGEISAGEISAGEISANEQ
ncbi:histidine phosphatase family protein [soil metagenome]